MDGNWNLIFLDVSFVVLNDEWLIKGYVIDSLFKILIMVKR